VLNGAPSLGQTFTVIDNDGTDPINGTFSGLPEGATVSTGMGNARITYRGGDGNDVVLTITSTSKNWTGAVSANWSDPNNWSPAAIPTPADTLLFPAAGTRRTMNDDLPAGTSVGPMIFGDVYTLNGNALTLTGSISGTGGAITISNDLKVGASLSLNNILLLSGILDVNGQALTVQSVIAIKTLNGSGSVTFAEPPNSAISGTGNFSGTMTGAVFLDGGSLPNATFTGAFLRGSGTIGGPVSVSGYPQDFYSALQPTSASCCTVINTGSLILNTLLRVKLDSGGVADRIHVAGSVTLGPQSLPQFPFPSGPSAPGDEWVIIDNDGTDPVNGTFAGTPEATMFDGPPWPFGFTYKGATGTTSRFSTLPARRSR